MSDRNVADGGGAFCCSSCKLQAPFEYFGRRPPFGSGVVFLEDAYVRRDPFSNEAKPLFLGGPCTLCSRPVCRLPTCSIFYSARFCIDCAARNFGAFPTEVQKDISSGSRSERN